jgi:predicted unusual protein kinase regulating ubiquinone biosynthesis (AarF/ABC1/UbiB family)
VHGYPDVRVPRVFHAQTARNVLTTEFVRGHSVRHVAEHGEQALRDRVGMAIFRFTLGTAFTRGVFNTDPHPGNYIIGDDGHVAFLDFGSVKFLPPALYREWRGLAMCLVEGRLDEWRRRNAALLGMEHMDPRARELNQEYMLFTAEMVSRDEEITIDRDTIRAAADRGIATAKKIMKEVGVMPSRGKTMRIPPDLVMVGRMQVGLFAVLAQLRPRANWHRALKDMLAATEGAG